MAVLRDKMIEEGRLRLEGDFREQTVEVLRVEVERYAVGEECNDEGPICYFELAEKELLLLWGQWLLDPDVVTSQWLDTDELWERKAWFKHFELVRTPASGLVLALTGIGREIITSVGTVGAGQRLPAQPSEMFCGGFDALLNES